MIDFNVSKSRYVRAVQCIKMYWMDRVKPEEFDYSVMDEAVLETGNEVGELAQKLFDNVSVVEYSDDKSQMINRTSEYIRLGKRYIAEASFAYKGRFLSVDILEVCDDGVIINEVKSSTSVKDVYLDDAAYQSYVLSLSGFNVKRVNVITLNSSYVRRGELDLTQLFSVTDVTCQSFSRHNVVEEHLESMSQLDFEIEPDMEIDNYCFEPYPCGYFGYCTKHLPEENIFALKNVFRKDKLSMYRSGIYSFSDVINERVVFSRLRPVVKDQLLKEKIVDKKEIGRFVSK
ncbi:MAG TPA: DUF2779 domain-containing protein, partial [Clostridia bacterium]|nr:DUF2779 domain-containing protein [Clostridia bacterium]